MKNAETLIRNPFWIYRCIRAEILFNYSEIWTTQAYKVLLTNSNYKIEKNSKAKKLFNSIIRWKNAKKPTKNPLWIYRCIRSEILFNYSKFEPQARKEFY